MKIKPRQLPVFEEGVFTPIVKDFIFYKRSCGLKYEDSAEYVLREICHQLNQYPIQIPELTQDMVFNIIERRPHEQYSTQARRITYVRQLAKYFHLKGYNSYIYPENSIHKEDKTFVPYIFNDEELENIFRAADSLPPHRSYPHFHSMYPVLIRLLFSSGLRF